MVEPNTFTTAPIVLSLAFAAVLLAGFAVSVWLSSRQIRHVARHRGAVPAAFSQTIALPAADTKVSKMDDLKPLTVGTQSATSGDELVQPGAFWEKPLSLLSLLNVGMRSNYVASYYAAPLMVARRCGLIVHTSSFGGTCYMHGPAYGAGKAAVDKMAHDMGVELRPHNVAVVSIWMGLLKTERTDVALSDPELARHYEHLLETMESPQLTGLVIDALARDAHLMDRSGRIWIGAELAQQYGIHDVDGRQPPSHRPMLGDPTVFSAAVIA